MSKALDSTAPPEPAADKPVQKRIRRSAEESRRVILDAAAKRISEQGPDGIRLQDIARDVGISHPAILHHFESRAGLVAALVDRTTAQLREKLLAVLEGGYDQKVESQMPSLVNNTFEALSDQGTAKLMAWMFTADASSSQEPAKDVVLEIAERGHQARVKLADKVNHPHPDHEDTLFLTLLIANAAFGEAIMGDYYYKACGLGDDPDAPQRFRKWLGKLLSDYSLPPSLNTADK
jgi:TetR/AcrR family transcriptional regulator, repressor for neighboring sulfatase